MLNDPDGLSYQDFKNSYYYYQDTDGRMETFFLSGRS